MSRPGRRLPGLTVVKVGAVAGGAAVCAVFAGAGWPQLIAAAMVMPLLLAGGWRRAG